MTSISKQLFKGVKEKPPSLKEICDVCHREVVKESLSGWMLGDNRCSCKKNNSLHLTTPPTEAPASPIGVCTDSQLGLVANATLEDASAPAARTWSVELGERYEIMDLLGSGGMGTVYKVRDLKLGTVFAVKVLAKDLALDPLSVQRFINEVEAASRLEHANVAAIYSHDRCPDGTPFLVMEYVEGRDLRRVLDKQPLPIPMAMNIFVQICDALEHAHARGIVHRDLKPSNILIVTDDQGTATVKIVDFGIARIVGPEKRDTVQLTQTGDIFGSPNYMSPEQCLGFECDARSDIYSLGCIMYESIAGRCPFVEPNHIQTIVSHLNAAPAPLRSIINAKVPQELNYVVLRTLEKDPVTRYQSAFDLRKDLELIVAGKRPKIQTKKHNSQTAAWLVMAVMNVVLVFSAFWQHSQSTHQLMAAKSIGSSANALSKLYYDAGVALGGKSITRSPLFSDRYEKIVRQIPEEIAELKRLAGDDKVQQESISRISLLCATGLQILSQASEDIDNSKIDPVQLRSRHMYKEIRALGDQLQEELHRLTEGPMRIARDPSWLARADALFGIELLAILLADAAVATVLIRRQNRLNQSLLWINQKPNKPKKPKK